MQAPWKNHYGPLVAFLVLALAGGFAIKGSADSSADKLYQSQLQSCHRGNLLREESNRRIEAHTIDRDALIRFLETARAARIAAYDRDHNASDLAAAEEYKKLADNVKAQVVFKPVELVDCDEEIHRP